MWLPYLYCTTYGNCRGEDGCCDPHTTIGVTQTAYVDNAEIDDAAREEIVDGAKDAVGVAGGEDEMPTTIIWTTSELINDNLTVVSRDNALVVYMWCLCD